MVQERLFKPHAVCMTDAAQLHRESEEGKRQPSPQAQTPDHSSQPQRSDFLAARGGADFDREQTH